HAVRRRRAADGVREVSRLTGEVEDERRPDLQDEGGARRPAVPTLVAYEIRPAADLRPDEAIGRRRVSDLDRERPVPGIPHVISGPVMDHRGVPEGLVPATRIGEEDRIRRGAGPIEAIRARGIPDVASHADASLVPHLVDAALVEDAG